MRAFIEQFIRDLADSSKLSSALFTDLIEIPQREEWGDLALPCFHLSKELRKDPKTIAVQLGEALLATGHYASVTPVNAYLNVGLNRQQVMQGVVQNILSEDMVQEYGAVGTGQKVIVEYSSPNITKPFHMGHLRTTVIGSSIAHIYRALGYNVVRMNYLGDWGTQFGKLITAFKRWGNREEVAADPIMRLTEMYIRFNSEMADDEDAQKEAREWFRKLESGDAEARELWNWFREESMQEFERLYGRLGTSFDEFSGESRYVDSAREIVAMLASKNLTRESEGAIIVDLEDDGLGVAIVRKTDGTSIYAVRDIAAAIDRFKTYTFDKMVYVTDAGQSLHFKQVFKVLEKMEQPFSTGLIHVPYGLVNLREGKMSTRKGNVVYLNEVLNKATDMVREIINEKNSNLEKSNDVAEAVGVGAIIFSQLATRTKKDILFDWKDVLNFAGETGPYVQYTYARLCSILRKHEIAVTDKLNFSLLSDDAAYTLGKRLMLLPDKIKQAAEQYEPSIIASYAIEVCTAVNVFYNKCRVLSDDHKEREARIALVECTRRIIHTSLELLGMRTPEEM